MISFRCACGRLLESPDSTAGTAIECPWCEATVEVPAASPRAETPEPGASEVASPPRLLPRGPRRAAVLLVGFLLGIGLLFAWRNPPWRAAPRGQAFYERVVAACRGIPAVPVPRIDADRILGLLQPLLEPSAREITARIDEARDLRELSDRWFEATGSIDPDFEVQTGFRLNPTLTRFDPRSIRREAWVYAATLRRLRGLPGEPSLDATLLERMLERDLALGFGIGFEDPRDPGRATPDCAFVGLNATYDLLLLKDGSEEERFTWLATRLEQVPSVVEEVLPGIEGSTRAKALLALDALPGYRALLEEWRKGASSLPESLRTRVDRAARAADGALAGLGDQLVRVRATARTDWGAGPALARFMIGGVEFSDWTFPQIVRLLDKAVEEGDAAKAGRSAEHTDVATPPFSEILERAQDHVEEARRFTVERALLTLAEDAPVRVVETPPHLRTWLPDAAYSFFLLSPKGDARMYMTPGEGGAGPSWGGSDSTYLASGTFHETYPGHHAFFLASRKSGWIRTAYPSAWTVEGWGTYAERLALEEGLLDGREGWDDFRRRRGAVAFWALVELAYCAGAVAEEEIVKAYGDVEEPDAIRLDLARITENPLHTLGYVLGEEHILRLRSEWGPQLGRLGFHDWFLSWGATPVALIRRELWRQPR
ncbi:MAG: DUF885 domain-containing protein [Planctomycetes bacterium]|nr:DUF885 domain-containing protein [Planctomycetota bacterium]